MLVMLHRLSPLYPRSKHCRLALAAFNRAEKTGLCSRSSAIVVGGPCPGITTVSFGRVKSFDANAVEDVVVRAVVAAAPPTLPAKSVSPVKTVDRKR